MGIYNLAILFIISGVLGCSGHEESESTVIQGPSIVILGTTQDAGSPEIGCNRPCCKTLSLVGERRSVVSLGLVDPEDKSYWLFEATPDITFQLTALNKLTSVQPTPKGIFLTHAHMGHYTGLMFLGREAINASGIEIFAMPKMTAFIKNNGPWNQLVDLNNITLSEIQKETSVTLSPRLKVTPFLVPHRDEYSETVGYKIIGPNRSAIFIPDIDKWSKWEKNIVEEIQQVDFALLDATFFDSNELQNRDMSEIPHPFVVESMELLKGLSQKEKSKVYFIHFNHTNPLLDINSKESKLVIANDFKIARTGQVLKL